MKNYICFDIETARNDSANAYYDRYADKLAPKNLKDPQKIQEAVDKKKNQAGLHWWTGKVIAIGAEVPGYEPICFMGDEFTILNKFRDWLYDVDGFHCMSLLGKSSSGFDIPFLIGRYMVYDCGIPKHLMKDRVIQDVDHMFSYSQSCSQVSRLEDYAWGLGIKGKSSEGSKVQEMYDNEQHFDIRDYCLQDVKIVAQMAKRYRESDKYTKNFDPQDCA